MVAGRSAPRSSRAPIPQGPFDRRTTSRAGQTQDAGFIAEEADGVTMLNGFTTFRRLFAATLLALAAAVAATGARAQQIVVIVNGEPITALDIEQRSKLVQLSTHKAPARQEVLDELINEKLKVREAKKWGLDVSNAEVDNAFASMASRMRSTPEQLTQQLAKSGVNVATLKARIKADLAWPQLVRGRYQASLQIGEKDVLTAMETKSDETGYDYTLRPILFLVPAGSPDTFVEGRKREAEALRGRFQGCEEGLNFARALRDVAVRDQVIRSSADIPPELRKVLEGIEIGRLTAPEVTKFGIEMFAICAKKESAADNTPGRRQARESVMAQRYEQRSKQYLQELRRGAMLEYK
jgi:peptidyl-prolyl cis-trans isomerase SurA